MVAKIWLSSWLLAFVLAALAISFALGRIYQYRRAGDPLRIRQRPRVPEARVVRAKAAAPKLPEPDPEPSETPADGCYARQRGA